MSSEKTFTRTSISSGAYWRRIRFAFKTVIDLSIKFMRLLNSYIVDLGTKYNKEDRVVCRGVRAEIFSNVKDGEIFRMISWNCASENLSTAEKFEKHCEGKASSLVKFNVKAHCFNAGQINLFGVSKYKSEEETLIPPYSACICIKKEKMKADDCTEEGFDTLSTKEEEKRDDFNTEPTEAEDREDDPKKKADGGKAERLRTVFVMNLAKDNKNIKKDLKCSF
ncbi:unnamed protein product [Moneuplotes crassus]|uniref:NAD(P)(+)--arginine ADP-ribosyltransferase n=1 Tax=Euplotes crassus TaxID=5936 RepID=A0AAD1X0U8_EUPCR|nr:unnamed protein product [Moneuplotes crassus]